jgi:hypothetical protein
MPLESSARPEVLPQARNRRKWLISSLFKRENRILALTRHSILDEGCAALCRFVPEYAGICRIRME